MKSPGWHQECVVNEGSRNHDATSRGALAAGGLIVHGRTASDRETAMPLPVSFQCKTHLRHILPRSIATLVELPHLNQPKSPPFGSIALVFGNIVERIDEWKDLGKVRKLLIWVEPRIISGMYKNIKLHDSPMHGTYVRLC